MNRSQQLALIASLTIVCWLLWQNSGISADFYEMNDKDFTVINIDRIVYVWKDKMDAYKIVFGFIEGGYIAQYELRYDKTQMRHSDFENLLKVLKVKKIGSATTTTKK